MHVNGTGEYELTVYQAHAVYLTKTCVFLYRLMDSLRPQCRQVVLANMVENQDAFPMPEIELLNDYELFSPDGAGRAARRLQRKHRSRVIHCHFGYSAARMVLLKHMLRLPMVTTLGGQDLAVHTRWPAMGRLYGYLFHACECLVAVSDHLRRRAIESGCPEGKIVTVHRGVDPAIHAPVDRSDRPAEPLRLLMVGRFVPKKGHAFALAALSQLKDGPLDWRLRIAGDGPLLGRIKAAANRAGLRERIRFLGHVTAPAVLAEMQAADLLLHPSVTGEDGDCEGIPNVILEAGATGLPCVGTRHGGIPEAVQDGVTGLLVPERDAAAFVGALRRLVGDRRQRLAMGGAAADFNRREFSIERQAAAYMEIYHRLARDFPPESPSMARVPADACLPALLRQARAEPARMGIVPVGETLEAIITAGGARGTRAALVHQRLSALRRLVPPAARRWLKGVLFGVGGRLMARSLGKAAEKDDARWGEIQKHGVPDPLNSCED